MENLTTVINVQVDNYDLEIANSILKSLGLNINDYVNMAIKQLIYKGDVPFKIKTPKSSRQLKKALKEGEKIIKDIKSGKRKPYDNVENLFRDLKKDL